MLRLASVLLVSLAAPATVLAQPAAGGTPDSLDAEARSIFEAGTTAFTDARYEDALGHFRRAYELSHRPELLYNIGISADRLRRDQEALDAFERFLAEVPEHARRPDVEARVLVLRRAVADAEPSSDGPDALSIVGPISLGAVGLAGVVAGLVGIAGAGGCIDHATPGDPTTPCVEESATNWAAVGIYGGLGLAAIAGAVIWAIVGLGGGDTAEAPVALGPRGAALSWRF
jgi:tetratricopeptide (TPR) repeat protein